MQHDTGVIELLPVPVTFSWSCALDRASETENVVKGEKLQSSEAEAKEGATEDKNWRKVSRRGWGVVAREEVQQMKL